MEKIETAPKDGTEILGWSKASGYNLWQWRHHFAGPPCWQCTGGYDMEDEPTPTHWANLPKPPITAL